MSAGALRILGGRPLRGAARLGPDLPILESTLAVAALASGRSELRGARSCARIELALSAWRALGVSCWCSGDAIHVDGPGLEALHASAVAGIECGSSALLLAQLAGVMSAQSFGARLLADASAREPIAPIEHWARALRARGAHLAAHGGDGERLRPPIAIAPLLASERLRALDASLPCANAPAKAALLLSGLYADGPTLIAEPQVSSDHLERALLGVGVPLRRIGSVVALDVQGAVPSFSGLGCLHMPGSAVAAAYLAAVVQWLPGSDVTLRHVSVNPSQSGVLDVLRSWGGALSWQPLGDAALREPVADLRVGSAAVRGGIVDADLLLRAGEALPALALLGAISRRGATLCDLSALAAHGDPGHAWLDPLFSVFGIAFQRQPDALHVDGAGSGFAERRQPRPLRRVNSHGDPRLALAGCALALASPGETVVEHAAEALAAQYPGFVEVARELGAVIEQV